MIALVMFLMHLAHQQQISPCCHLQPQEDTSIGGILRKKEEDPRGSWKRPPPNPDCASSVFPFWLEL